MTTHAPAATARQADQADQADQAAQYGRRWLTLGLLSVAQFMLVLDVTVVNVALPSIGTSLHLSRAALTWVITTYTLCFGGLMLLGGRSADLFGARRVLLTGLMIFTGASLLAGLASGPEVLLGGRAAQGIGAALMSPAALSIVTLTFQGRERHRALGVWAAIAGAGSAIGVLLGGALTAGPGWRWVFFINVPVGIALLAAMPAVVLASRPGGPRRRIDLPGAAVVTAATGAAIYGLINAGGHGWTALSTLVPLAGAAVLYAVFAAVERAMRDPLMNLRMLTRRPVAAGAFFMLTATGLLVGGFFLGSFYLQDVHGYGALTTGLMFLPVAIATIIGAHTASQAVGHLGTRTVACAALILAAVGAGSAAVWTSVPVLVAGLSLAAAGIGATFVAATTTALANVGHREAGVASGVLNTFHELGGAIGVSVVSSIAAVSLTAGATTGFSRAFGFSAIAALAAALIAATLVPAGKPPAGVRPHGH